MIAELTVDLPRDPVALRQHWSTQHAQGEQLRLANPRQAMTHARAAFDAAQKLNDELAIAKSECLYARVIADTGQARDGLKHALNALARFDALNNEAELALAQSATGYIYCLLGDYENALAMFEPAERIATQLRDNALLLRVLGNMSLVYASLHKFDEARNLMERTLSLAQAENNGDLILRSLANMGYMDVEHARDLLSAGDNAQATQYLERAVQTLHRALQSFDIRNSPFDQGIAHFNLGSAYAELGDLDLAQQHLELALDKYKTIGNAADLLDADLVLASVWSKRGQHAAALQTLQRCVEGIERSEGDQALLVRAWREYSAAAERAGDLALALSTLKKAHAAERETFNKRVSDRAAALSIKIEMERAQLEADILRIHAEQLLDKNTELAGQANMLSRQANEDVLTELSNRRYFDEQFPKLMETEHAHSMFVALVDLDHFKRVNDDFSHAIGDQVLRQVSAILRAHSRTDDLVARYGGEEFILVLLHVNAEQARAACERLRTAVEERNWAALAPGLSVTMSIGLAKVDPARSAQANIDAADKLLYRAKDEGRNRVCM
jgi:diguanylate cyclase (GGDEF)-like protein